MSFKVREKLQEIDSSDTRSYINDRWLNLESMEEAAAGFFSYDPEQWMPTLQVRFTPFIFYPWLLITGVGFVVTWFAMTEPACTLCKLRRIRRRLNGRYGLSIGCVSPGP